MKSMCASFLIFSLGLYEFSHGNNCEDMSDTARLVIRKCLKSSKITQIRTFQCYSANSQGGCDEGERLVVNRGSDCYATHCIDNKDAEGTPCPDGLITYNGRCEIGGSKSACEGEGKGKRLYADLYGAVSCKCSLDHGYVEVNGTCYHQHFRGPCNNGQSLQNKTVTWEWECIQDNCGSDQVMWEDGRCYDVKTPPEDCEEGYDLQRKDGMEGPVMVGYGEKVENLLEVACTDMTQYSGGTFSNCAAESSTGLCLARRKQPRTGAIDTKKLLCMLLPNEC